ncbi:hypothetical protein CROQUDRAFT_53412 [Cronartium quercuum f. sp. fusiforme G11]|uniref:AAA+ ATPase domain-containing protein n=1 Tax=Cronartium quercuum f. sp. fusiforme G11 TaxID=708437 RepID=A0A9P6N6D7_9BASI|nr:hypothetical protein CROQUDRAFT_53412 [Cronartium quercuum f. sp. fusiforme G11]
MNAFDALRAGASSRKAAESAPQPITLPAALPWVEKYRPKSIESVEGQESTTRVLAKALHRADLPHMLFYGPPGTGKTSTILALARELFGPELMKSRVLELNASDERGISVVREKVKNFAKVAISPSTGGFPCPPFKIIILDEADSMTQDAQSALRRIMENYSKITRFCLICNYVTRIIEPIVSRCSKFRFKPLSSTGTLSKLHEICKLENIQVSEPVLVSLIKVSDGDLRRSITFLQSASKLRAGGTGIDSMAQDPGEITQEDVEEIGGVVPDREMRKLLKTMGIDNDIDGDVEMTDVNARKKTRQTPFEKISSGVELIMRQGYSSVQLISQLHDLLLLDSLIPARAKTVIAMAIGEADKKLTDGADEELQVLSICLKVWKAMSMT